MEIVRVKFVYVILLQDSVQFRGTVDESS